MKKNKENIENEVEDINNKIINVLKKKYNADVIQKIVELSLFLQSDDSQTITGFDEEMGKLGFDKIPNTKKNLEKYVKKHKCAVFNMEDESGELRQRIECYVAQDKYHIRSLILKQKWQVKNSLLKAIFTLKKYKSLLEELYICDTL